MIDTSLETSDATAVLAEAKKLGAEVALLLTSAEKGSEVVLRENVFWVADGSRFVDAETVVGAEYVKNLKFGEEFFTPGAGKPVLRFDLTFDARFVATGDVDGDGKQEIVLGSGNRVRTYSAGVDLQFLREMKGPASEEYINLDLMDLNKDGKDEIILTSMKNDEVVSHIYGYDDSGFQQLWEGKYFLHRVGDRLFAQAYSASDGFSGDVYSVDWNGAFKIGERVKLPEGVNVYDFAYLQGDKGPLIFAYDDGGFLNLYDEKGMLLWRSPADTGGFLTTFKKKSGTFMSAGEWSVKDRLVRKQNEILVIRRKPLAEMARGLGFKSSQLMDYWWNGFSIEEKVLIDDIAGTLLDYSFNGEEIAVLASPFMGIKFGNILKGENPLGIMLYIYSVKGR